MNKPKPKLGQDTDLGRPDSGINDITPDAAKMMRSKTFDEFKRESKNLSNKEIWLMSVYYDIVKGKPVSETSRNLLQDPRFAKLAFDKLGGYDGIVNVLGHLDTANNIAKLIRLFGDYVPFDKYLLAIFTKHTKDKSRVPQKLMDLSNKLSGVYTDNLNKAVEFLAFPVNIKKLTEAYPMMLYNYVKHVINTVSEYTDVALESHNSKLNNLY